VWRNVNRPNHWHAKLIKASTLVEALEKVFTHLQVKHQLAPGIAELDHFVQEFHPENGHQQALHTLTRYECPLPVVFQNKSRPPGHFPTGLALKN
jgi:murein endopeptidase